MPNLENQSLSIKRDDWFILVVNFDDSGVVGNGSGV